jgi:hypothetical protein
MKHTCNTRHGKCLTCPFNDTEESIQAQNYGCLPTPQDIMNGKNFANKEWRCHSDESLICGGLAEHSRTLGSGKPVALSLWAHGKQTLLPDPSVN